MKSRTVEIKIKDIEKWLDLLNFWADYIENISWEHPKTKRKYDKFVDLLTDLTSLTKNN